jgi:hypothetical protein
MFECAECSENYHPRCSTPGGERIEANDLRFDHYECKKCIIQQIQAQVTAIKEAKDEMIRPNWVIKDHESASKKKWNEARIRQKARTNIGDNYYSARQISQLPEFEKGQLVWVAKEITRLMITNAWGPYVVDQILNNHQYKLINHENGAPTKPVSGRYLKPYQKNDTRDTCRQEYSSDS